MTFYELARKRWKYPHLLKSAHTQSLSTGGCLEPFPHLQFRFQFSHSREGDTESVCVEGDQLPECVYYPPTPIKLLCQCVAIVSSWVRLLPTTAAILMTQSVWGSEDNGALEPPQSARLMLPFQPTRSAAECARLLGKWSGAGPGGLSPIKTQARVSSPTLIILDLSHLSTVCKYIMLPHT